MHLLYAAAEKSASYHCTMCLVTTSVVWCHHIPYCPGQVPMGAHSSSAKIWVWTFAQRRCLNGSTIPLQGPTLDVKVIYQVALNRLASSLRPCFIEARTTMEKAVTCYKVDLTLPSFCCIQLSLAVREFCAAGEERCQRSHRQVCTNLMSRHPKRVRTIAVMWSTCTFELLCMVGATGR